MASNKTHYQVAPTASTTCTWLTPKYVMDALQEANQGVMFDVDPCTPPTQPWPTAKRRFTVRTDGLRQPGEKKPWNPQDFYWMNPPYGREIADWMQALANQGNGIGLIFSRTDTKWWHQTVARKAAGLFFIEGRLRFCDAKGNPGGTSPASSVLIAYGPRALKVLERIEKTQSIRGYLVR